MNSLLGSTPTRREGIWMSDYRNNMFLQGIGDDESTEAVKHYLHKKPCDPLDDNPTKQQACKPPIPAIAWRQVCDPAVLQQGSYDDKLAATLSFARFGAILGTEKVRQMRCYPVFVLR